MEVSALKYQGAIGLHGRSPLLRLQSDERLIALIRRGNTGAFEVLLGRYESRLLAFCRHLLGSREDAEDVLQEVMTAAFHAIVADERAINVRPWLYRIARNRSLNHLRKNQAIGVDSMDHHLSEHGASAADKVHEREEFRLLVGDIHELPETQKTALVLREMDALSYEQIAEAMETTVSSVKSLLVRARVSLAEAAEARLLSCEEVRIELAEVAEGLMRRPSPLVRRHLKACKRCTTFRTQLKATNKALAALLPVGPLVVLRKLALLHLGHSAASAGSGAGAGATATAAGSTAGVGAGAALAGSGAFGGGGLVSAGIGAVATKAAAGLAAAAIVTAGAVEVDHHQTVRQPAAPVAALPAPAASAIAPTQSYAERPSTVASDTRHVARHSSDVTTATSTTTPVATAPTTATSTTPTTTTTATTPATSPGRVQTQTDPTVLPPTATAPPVVTPTTTEPEPVTTTPVQTAPTVTQTAPADATTAPVTTASPAPTATTTPAAATSTPLTTPTTSIVTTPGTSTTPTTSVVTTPTTPTNSTTGTTSTTSTSATPPAIITAPPALPDPLPQP